MPIKGRELPKSKRKLIDAIWRIRIREYDAEDFEKLAKALDYNFVDPLHTMTVAELREELEEMADFFS